jgi:chemotaxis protein MotB
VALTSFREAADVRVEALGRKLTAEIVRRAEAARAEADALVAEVTRGQAERIRLAEQAGSLEQALASLEAELAAAEARATEAERAATEAERTATEAQHAATEARREAAEAAAWKAAYDDLERTFRREIAAREVALQRLAQGVSLSISDRVLFPSGAADISEDGVRILDRVVGALQKLAGRRVRIEGHTDNVPIGPVLRTRYPSNWELSTARATAVVGYLVTRGVSSERLAVAGYAETRPVAPNTSEEGRAQNRRIEIVVVPEPGPAEPPREQGT